LYLWALRVNEKKDRRRGEGGREAGEGEIETYIN
jgi:hypothetical protein